MANARLDGLICARRSSNVAPGEVAGILVPAFVKLWGPDGPLLPLLRAAASNRLAADALIEIFTDRVTPALAAVAVDRPRERAALIGSHLIGIAVARHVIGVPPLIEMSDDTLVAWLGPVFAHYLSAVYPSAAEEAGEPMQAVPSRRNPTLE